MIREELRPRSKLAHEKVLEAAVERFAERGIEGTSIDSIAAASGVSKATIYKHWQDKNALCLEAIGRVHGLHLKRPEFNSGDLLQDMIDFLKYRPPECFSLLRERMMPHVIAYAASDAEFGRAWRARVLEPGRRQAVELLRRGIASGIFPEDLDISLSLALLIGPIMHSYIFRGIGPAAENLEEGVANAFWRAFARKKTRR